MLAGVDAPRHARCLRPEGAAAVRGGRRWLLLAVSWLSGLAAGCHARPSADELVVLVETPAATADPRFCVTAQDFKLSRLLFSPLVSVDDERAEPRLELAESLRPLDERHWELRLREARFSDGRAVEAADVVYTLDSMRDPAVRSPMRQRLASMGLEQVEALDGRTLRFTLAGPHAPFESDLNFGILARPVGAPNAEPPLVGAGPFVLESREGETLRLVRNPLYFGGAPPQPRVTLKTIRDDNSRLLALVGGSGDLTQNTISPLLIDAVAAQPALRVESGRSAVYSYLGFNLEDPLLADVRVRRALALALDRARLVSAKLHGRAVLATGMLPTFHWAYAADVPLVGYDPAEARRLLDEAGHPVPPSGGPRFTLVYKTSNNRFRVAMAQVIRSMLEDVGVGVDLQVLEFATFFADVKRGNFQLFSMQIPEISEPDLYTNFFHSSRIPTRDNPDAGGNRMRYRSAALDRLLEQGRRTLDREARRRIYAAVQHLLADELPVVSLWHEDNLVALRKEVSGYQVLPTAQLTSLARTTKRAP
jgi:peptide/nickel transport system substrate-binding protein